MSTPQPFPRSYTKLELTLVVLVGDRFLVWFFPRQVSFPWRVSAKGGISNLYICRQSKHTHGVPEEIHAFERLQDGKVVYDEETSAYSASSPDREGSLRLLDRKGSQ